jgi:predicted nucleotidyltransferase
MRSPTEHELMLMSVADVLGVELLELVTFVGGATVSLHLDDAQPIDIRSTKDVDFIVSVTSYAGYQELSQKLREVGFKEYIPEDDETPLCRFVCDGILVDVMPDDENILGFSNEWFKPCQQDPVMYDLPHGVQIKIAKAKYLLATKLAAFFGRKIDILESKDAEDICILVNGRDALLEEVFQGPSELISYIQLNMTEFISDNQFEYLFANALDGEVAERIDIVLDRFHQLASTKV